MNSDIEVVELERLQMGVSVAVSDALAQSMEIKSYRDVMLRSTVHQITGWFASRKIYEETRTMELSLGWRDRIRVLFGKPVVYKMTVEMRHNCPHLAMPERHHVNWLAARQLTASLEELSRA